MPQLPGQMFQNMLNPAKGWPSQNALDFTAKVSGNVLYTLVAGQVAHLNPSGQLEPGVVNNQMGLFIFQGASDFDVDTRQGPPTSNPSWTPISPRGGIMCLVAKGPYELETTEFDATQTYTINQPLRAPSGNGATAYPGSGQLTNQGVTLASQSSNPSTGATAICGIVSRGAFINSYGVKVLSFWPVWYPGKSTET